MRWMIVTVLFTAANLLHQAQGQQLTQEEANDEARIVLAFTRKMHAEIARMDESVDILKTKIWPGLKNKIVSSFNSQMQEVSSLFRARKTETSKCNQNFKNKLDGLVAEAESTFMNSIETDYSDIQRQNTELKADIDSAERMLMTNMTKVKEACTSPDSDMYTCVLHNNWYLDLTERTGSWKLSSRYWHESADKLRASVITAMNSIIEKYDTKLMSKKVHAAVAECLVTFQND